MTMMRDVRLLLWLERKRLAGQADYWVRSLLGYRFGDESLSNRLYGFYLILIGIGWIFFMWGYAVVQAEGMGKLLSPAAREGFSHVLPVLIGAGQLWLLIGALRLTPLNVAQTFQSRVQQLGTKSWIYTSATLAVGEDFNYFARRLGLEDAQTAQWSSPFNYEQNALLYVPSSLPDPGAPDYTERVIDAALPVLRASGGRAFILFTSHRALRTAAERIKDRLDYPLLVQGSMSRSRLLERFVDAGNAVLLGTGSFWEGVDVRGPALSCVIIDKLPFATPDDPVLKARAMACSTAGGNPFFEFQLPEAAIALKQGAGRLIRSAEDSGVLMLCDPRLFSRSYGRVFLDSLPIMPVSRDLSAVEKFFRERVAVDNLA